LTFYQKNAIIQHRSCLKIKLILFQKEGYRMSKLFVVGAIVCISGAVVGLGLEKKWGLWFTVIGILFAIIDLFISDELA
jgi:hypothetical protein